MSHIPDTICALATAPGVGGVAIVRVSGTRAFSVVDSLRRRGDGRSCRTQTGHTLRPAKLVDGDGQPVDDALLAVFHAPRSLTGEDVVEVHAHGGPVPVRRILGLLYDAGARPAEPGEFTQRAFLNGKIDLAQAEAVADMVAAQTDAAHRLALRQGEGRLSGAVRAVRETALGVLARIEAAIDFPEDVGELDADSCLLDLDNARSAVDALLSTANRGILTRAGLSLVLAGRPNVGKSSLLNALLGVNRAIVTDIPGTTRDTVEETVLLGGLPVRAADTAGLRDTSDPVEQEGVRRTWAALSQADLIVYVLDAVQGDTAEDRRLRSSLPSGVPVLVVWNKWDVVEKHPPSSFAALTGSPLKGGQGRSQDAGHSPNLPVRGNPAPQGSGGLLGAGEPLPLSAATGWNLSALEDAIVDAVGAGDAVPSDGAVVTHARHRHALEAAREALNNARRTLSAGLPIDLVSGDAHAAIDHLGEVTGETASADIIGEIFSRFCIGK